MPALDHETKQTVFYPPAFLAPRSDKKPVILFFDKISLAPDDTRSAVLGILEERRQADIKIPDNWLIVAAGNRPEDLANARGLGAAANRRLLHIVIEPQLEATLDYFIKIGVIAEVLAFLKVFFAAFIGRRVGTDAETRTLPSSGFLEKGFGCLSNSPKKRTPFAPNCGRRNYRRFGRGGIYDAGGRN